MTVSGVIMSPTKNGMKLFQGIEQGSGKMNQNTCIYFKPHMRSEAQKWIRVKHGKTFKIKNKDKCETIVPIQTKADKENSNEIHDFIIDRL